MATKSGQPEPEKAEVVEALLDDLDAALDRVKVLYEQYFLGIQKQPPTYLHTDLERKIRDIAQLQVRNTALRYRFATLQQKFGSYNAYWRRTLRQIENGTYTRNLSKIGRQAARTGAEVPEEILAAMPRRMRDQVVRDREAALALARLREQQRADAARSAARQVADADGDDVDHAALIVEPDELRRSVVGSGGAYRLDDDGDFDLDAYFAAMTNEAEPDPPGAAGGRPAGVAFIASPPPSADPAPPLDEARGPLLRPGRMPGASTGASAPVAAPATRTPASGEPVAAPATRTPATGVPVVAAPATRTPATGIPVVAAPGTRTPATGIPVVAAPGTRTPASGVPVVVPPATRTPASGVPVVAAPATSTPASGVPVVAAPATRTPATGVPVVAAAATRTPARGVTVVSSADRPSSGHRVPVELMRPISGHSEPAAGEPGRAPAPVMSPPARPPVAPPPLPPAAVRPGSPAPMQTLRSSPVPMPTGAPVAPPRPSAGAPPASLGPTQPLVLEKPAAAPVVTASELSELASGALRPSMLVPTQPLVPPGRPPLAPSQATRPNPIAPGASAARGPTAVETMAGPFPRIPPPPPPALRAQRSLDDDSAPTQPIPPIGAPAVSGGTPPRPVASVPGLPGDLAPAPARVPTVRASPPPPEPMPSVRFTAPRVVGERPPAPERLERPPAPERLERPSAPERLERPHAPDPSSERSARGPRDPAAPHGLSEAEVDALYTKYVQAKQTLGEAAGPGAYGKLLQTINAQAPKIRQQYKARAVDFSVVVKDNQVIIRAKPKP